MIVWGPGMTVEALSASSIAKRPQNSPFLLQVLVCLFASTRELVCEYSRVRLRVLTSTRALFTSSTLASFDSRVGSAPLVWTCERAQMILACIVASDASRSHTHAKLRLSGTVVLYVLLPLLCFHKYSIDQFAVYLICSSWHIIVLVVHIWSSSRSHSVHPEVLSERIWGYQGTDLPAFPYFAEPWVMAM